MFNLVCLILQLCVALLTIWFYYKGDKYCSSKAKGLVLVKVLTKEGKFYSWLSVRTLVDLDKRTSYETVPFSTKEGVNWVTVGDIISIVEVDNIFRAIFHTF